MKKKTISLISGLITLVIVAAIAGAIYFGITYPDLAFNFVIYGVIGFVIIWITFIIYEAVSYWLDGWDHRSRRRKRGM